MHWHDEAGDLFEQKIIAFDLEGDIFHYFEES